MDNISSLIEQIQNDIINPKIGLEDILLKSKVLAHYLNNDEIKKWITYELEGYPDYAINDFPDYRFNQFLIRGTIKTYYRLVENYIIPESIIPPKLKFDSDRFPENQSISELKALSQEDNHKFVLPGDWVVSFNYYNYYRKSCNYELISAHIAFPINFHSKIIATVRNRLLDFILEISNLPWNISSRDYLIDNADKVFHCTINNNNNSGVNMSNSQKYSDRSIKQTGNFGVGVNEGGIAGNAKVVGISY